MSVALQTALLAVFAHGFVSTCGSLDSDARLAGYRRRPFYVDPMVTAAVVLYDASFAKDNTEIALESEGSPGGTNNARHHLSGRKEKKDAGVFHGIPRRSIENDR